MNIDLTKYTFVTHTRKDGRVEVIAISTFAGKPVRGKAICAESDDFVYEKGIELAAARCNAKIAAKRYARAKQKIAEAEKAVAEATKFYDNMRHYRDDAYHAMIQAGSFKNKLEGEL
jgi:hypothetical protein